VIVTITAPIRQDSKTGAGLEVRIRELLKARRVRLKATIYGNLIQVRVLKGGASRTSKLIGFVHNPKPDPSVLFAGARLRVFSPILSPMAQRGGYLVRYEYAEATSGSVR
jgi:hypothetical protein